MSSQDLKDSMSLRDILQDTGVVDKEYEDLMSSLMRNRTQSRTDMRKGAEPPRAGELEMVRVQNPGNQPRAQAAYEMAAPQKTSPELACVSVLVSAQEVTSQELPPAWEMPLAQGELPAQEMPAQDVLEE